MTDDPLRTCTGAQLVGARALGHSYLAHAIADGRDIDFEALQEMHEAAGLTDGWTDRAVEIGVQTTDEVFKSMQIPAGAGHVVLPVAALRSILCVAYVRGMTIGSMAALNVVIPGESA